MEFKAFKPSPISATQGMRTVGALLVLVMYCLAGAQSLEQAGPDGLRWRNIGPFRGGRASAISGAVGVPGLFYAGFAQGGVWKTTSNGQTWYPVFDSVKGVSCIGSVQVAPSDAGIVYVGTGEFVRVTGQNEGNGMYKSTDGGATWQHIGLEGTKHIPSILVDPHDPNLVLCAAEGDLRTKSGQRGVFRTTDGGKTWTRSLAVSDEIGGVQLSWDPSNPKVVLAATGRHYMTTAQSMDPTFNLMSEGTMIYRSDDEGLTWTKIPGEGLPQLTGRIGTAIAPGTECKRMFVIGTFGLYRSDDGGAHWRQMAVGDPRIANGQGSYSCGVFVDPHNPDVVYTVATAVYRSIDGGKSFVAFKGAPGGDDPHDLWIDPSDSKRILWGGDQGLSITVDGGLTWGPWYNLPTAQIYHLDVDNQWPYWVYGPQQDSGCVAVASRGNYGAITPFDWSINPGSEFDAIAVDPLDHNISYAIGYTGNIMKITFPSGQFIDVGPTVNPDSGLHQFFSPPFAFSPVDPHELIEGFQCLMATSDGGAHWKAISPDLTAPKVKPDKPAPRFGPTAISAFCQSVADPNVMWVGTDNGLIKLTRDHGKTWEDVSIPNLPNQDHMIIVTVEPSHRDPGTAYVAADEHFFLDYAPHFYRTRDFGKTWTEIVNGLPNDEWVNVIREDTVRPGLLFAGTEEGVYVSFDAGDHWQSLMFNLPTTSFRDLKIKGNDLVAATFGRGFWILDDFSPLREMSADDLAQKAYLFKPGSAVRVRRSVNGATPFPPEVPQAENPPAGAILYYSLSTRPSGEIKIEIADENGEVVRHMSSAAIVPYDNPPALVPDFWAKVRRPLPTTVGLHRINWNLRYDTPPAFNHDYSDVMTAIPGETPAGYEGPLVLPGKYTVRLIVDGKTYSQTLEVVNDPRSPASAADLKAQNSLQLRWLAGVQVAYEGATQVSAVESAVKQILAANPPEEVAKAGKDLEAKLEKLHGEPSFARVFYGPPDPSSFVGLNGYLLFMMSELETGDMAPNDGYYYLYGSCWKRVKSLLDEWRTFAGKDLTDFNGLLSKHGLPAVKPGPDLEAPPAPDDKYLPAKAPDKP